MPVGLVPPPPPAPPTAMNEPYVAPKAASAVDHLPLSERPDLPAVPQGQGMCGSEYWASIGLVRMFGILCGLYMILL